MTEVKESFSALSATGSFSLLKAKVAAAKKGEIFNFPGSLSRKSPSSSKSVPVAATTNLHKPSISTASCFNFPMGRGRFMKSPPTCEAPSATSVDSRESLIKAASSVILPTEIPKRSQDFSLPVLKFRTEIIKTIRNTHVTIIRGATGSGKTTQVPQFILNDAKQRNESCNIIISQPRKIAAITVAKRVAEERGCMLGKEVGYQVGLSKKVDTEENTTKLLFCTTGVILQKVVREKNLSHYSHVVLDEVHDREVDLDLLVTIVREILLHISDETKLVLMSATLDVEKFVEYFTFKYDSEHIPAVLDIDVERVFKIRKIYNEEIGLTEADINYERPGIGTSIYKKAKQIIEERLKTSNRSILVFLPGIYEINSMNAILHSDSSLAYRSLVCVLHSSLSSKEQQIAFTPASKPKVILSTNIAESSVTISGIDCVIDFCLTKYLESDKKSATAGLRTHWASQNSLEQRAGRTGRTCDGIVYRLINRRYFDRLPVQTSPEMERVPLETTVLRVKMLDIEPPTCLLAKTMDPPKRDLVVRAIMILKELGGLERLAADNSFIPDDGELTYVGQIMAALPLDARLSKLIVMGYVFSVLDEAIVIAAGLNMGGIFRNRYGLDLDDYVRKLEYADGSGCDSVALYNAFTLWKGQKEQGHFINWQAERNWCEKYQLDRKSLHEMLQLIEDIKNRLTELQLSSLVGESSTSWSREEKPFALKMCLAATFIPNYFIYGASTLENEDRIHKEVGWKNPYNSIYLKCRDKGHYLQAYVEQIKAEVVKAGICRNVDTVKVTVDQGSSKVFIEFVNDSVDDARDSSKALNTLTPGYAAPEVYKALKVASQTVGFKLRIKVMDDDDLCLYIRDLGILDERGNIKKIYYKQPANVAIPATCVPSLPAIVTHIEHCSKFWMQPMTELNKKNLQKLDQDLEKIAKSPVRNTIELKGGDLVVLQHGNKWKRAKVMSINARDGKVKCFIYDFGQTDAMPVEQVFKVKEKSIFDLPQLCFEASLSEIRPSAIKCPRGLWTAEAVRVFEKLIEGNECLIDVYSVFDDIASVSLWAGQLNINQTLIKLGFAKDCKESFPRKDAHFDRLKNQSSKSQFFNVAEEFQQKVDKIATNPVPHPPMRSCTKFLTFTGPLSPMKCKVNSIFANGSPSCSVHPLSVNSILLYDDPSNFYGCLMVAANCTTTNNAETILHDTTLMPNLPGLPVLMAMMFSPEVVFKRNDDMTRFEYIKFGLGCSTCRRVAMFAEHDCVLPVNIELTKEDFDEINEFRFFMSYLLMTKPGDIVPGLKKDEKFELLSGIKTLLMKILSKKRRILTHTFAPSSEDWIVDNQEDALVYKEPIQMGGGQYHQLDFPQLYKMNRVKAEKLIKQVESVKDDYTFQIGGSNATCRYFVCPMCEIDVEDYGMMQFHFHTEAHMNGFKMLQEALED